MTRRVARAPEERATARGRKSTQRARLLASVIAVVGREGYAGASVSRIIAEAGVSRPTFYEYFKDKESCFLEALDDVHARLMERVRQRVAENPPQLALHASLGAIVELASTEHDRALFLTSQAMGAGPRALEARDAGIGEIERVLGHSLMRPPDEAGHDTSQPLAPGMLASHYAPRTPVRLNAVSVEAGEALLAFGDGVVTGIDAATVTMNLTVNGDLNEAAAHLFGYLRALDSQRARAIAVMPIPHHGLGEAINDRLRRAAMGRE